MISSIKIAAFILCGACALHAANPDISNLNKCIQDVRDAAAMPPAVPTFHPYMGDYYQLMSDLQTAAPNLPYVYQQIAVKPLVQFLQNLGESEFLRVFEGEAADEDTAVLQQIIPDAVLAVLSYEMLPKQGTNAFQEIVSDLYDSFLSEEVRLGDETGVPIEPPNYGVVAPLVKFGDSDSGPYTWPGDATKQVLGMGCGIVSLPPEQLHGGLLAWSSLGHETGGHDVLHADKGLLDELAQKTYNALLQKFNSRPLATYWANCIDEAASDVCGYLHMGPSLGVGLIGYFRALGNGKLRTVGYKEGPHPIDLLRGYLAAAVAKRLSFKGASAWSQVITAETQKDNGKLYLINAIGLPTAFPVSLSTAIASTEVVAQVIMQSKLIALQKHALRELQDWTDKDQAIVDNLVATLKMDGQLPTSLRGPGFYAAHVVAGATQAALQNSANVSMIFGQMQDFLATMHIDNPTWSQSATDQSLALVDSNTKGRKKKVGKHVPRVAFSKLPEPAAQ